MIYQAYKSPKQYESVLMDWDGCIAKTLDIWHDAYAIVLSENGYPVHTENITRSFGSFVALMYELGNINPELEMKRAVALAASKLDSAVLYDGALELLQYLDEIDVKTALITSSENIHISEAITNYKLSKFFKGTVTGEMAQHRKPHTEPFEIAMEILDSDIKSSIVIGDSASDILPANQLGIDSVLFFPRIHQKYYSKADLIKLNPTYIVENLSEIKNIITR